MRVNWKQDTFSKAGLESRISWSYGPQIFGGQLRLCWERGKVYIIWCRTEDPGNTDQYVVIREHTGKKGPVEMGQMSKKQIRELLRLVDKKLMSQIWKIHQWGVQKDPKLLTEASNTTSYTNVGYRGYQGRTDPVHVPVVVQQDKKEYQDIPVQVGGMTVYLRGDGELWEKLQVMGAQVWVKADLSSVRRELTGLDEGEKIEPVMEQAPDIQWKPPQEMVYKWVRWLLKVSDGEAGGVMFRHKQTGEWKMGIPKQDVNGSEVFIDNYAKVLSTGGVEGYRKVGTIHTHPGSMTSCSHGDVTKTFKHFSGIHLIAARSGDCQLYVSTGGVTFKLTESGWDYTKVDTTGVFDLTNEQAGVFGEEGKDPMTLVNNMTRVVTTQKVIGAWYPRYNEYDDSDIDWSPDGVRYRLGSDGQWELALDDTGKKEDIPVVKEEKGEEPSQLAEPTGEPEEDTWLTTYLEQYDLSEPVRTEIKAVQKPLGDFHRHLNKMIDLMNDRIETIQGYRVNKDETEVQAWMEDILMLMTDLERNL